MEEEKKSAPYMLRVVLSEKELAKLDRICELDGNATRSVAVRRAIEYYGVLVNKNYAKQVAAQRQAERAASMVSPLEEARKRIEANTQRG